MYGQPPPVASCSPLYVRMRNAVVARPIRSVGGPDVPMTELQRRLQQLSSSLSKGTAPHDPSTYAMPSSASLAGLPPGAPPSSSAAAGYNSHHHNNAVNPTVQQGYMAEAEADEEALRVADLLPVRVIELEDSVELRANTDSAYTSTEGRPPNMDLVCADARVKIFARHVVAARADSGAPVAELVLEELFQLSEDEGTNSLLFFLGPRPAGDGRSIAASTIVEFKCQSLAQLRSLYKLVSIRRSAVEALKAQEQH